MRSQLIAARAAALFVSDMSAADSRPSATAVEAAIAEAVRARGGTRGCVALMATAYGDCPETAAPRMRWARAVVLSVYATPHRDLVLAA